MGSVIPPDLVQSIEQQTGARIVAERPRGGGGASRQGAEIVLGSEGGVEQRCYLAWDERAGDPARRPFFQRETAVLSALSGPLGDSGVRVAPLLASEPAHLALCSKFVEGQERFPDASDKAAVARDFVAQLAQLHALDAGHPSFAPLGDPAQPPSRTIRNRLATLSVDNLAGVADPILQLALEWLKDNVPADSGPAVVLHGDAGPGNFLYDGDRVTALVDWELTHLGDPMEDLAQIWVRSLIQPFVPMRDVFAAYAEASGRPVDVERVKYHRLYFQLGFSVKPRGPVAATGTALLYGTMHRRIITESLAELSAVALTDPELPECPPSVDDLGFALALDDLRNEIVPGLASQRAASKAKALARMVKFWRNRDRYGSAFDAQEKGEIERLLGGSFQDVHFAREALGRAIAAGEVAFPDVLQLCHNRTVRETRIMADAMGALATTCYEDCA